MIEKTSEEDINDTTLMVIEVNSISANDKCVMHNEHATQEQIAQLQKLLDDNDDLLQNMTMA